MNSFVIIKGENYEYVNRIKNIGTEKLPCSARMSAAIFAFAVLMNG